MSQYKSVGHRYLSFCWKACRIGRKEAFERWAIRFTDEQWSLLDDLTEELEADWVISRYDSGFHSSKETEGKKKDQDKDEDGDGDGDEYQDDDNSDHEGEQDGEGITSPRQDALDRAVFRFIVASIKTHVGGNTYTNSLLCFCAALGIKSRPMGYIEPHQYTGLLAGIVWWARFFFLEAAFENEPLDRDEVGVEAVLAFEKQHTSWMCMGTHTVMSTIIGWMAYGKGYRQKMGGQPSIRWSEGGEGLFHMGEHISVEDFTRTLRNEVTEAEKLLDKLFGGFWQPVSKKINMGRIVDNMIRLGAGQSFASNPKNKWLEAGPEKVMRLIEASIWDAARARLKRQRVKRWLRDLKLLRETLLVLVHTWGGLPGRGPEITTLRHCDSWQLLRNIFMLDGQVMIVTDRDKMKAIRDNGRKVARFMPDRIGRMIVAYITWLLPTERVLRRECQLAEPRGEQLEYMWRDGCSSVWETDRLSRQLGRVMQAGTGVRLGVGRYRAIAIEMGRKIRGLVMKQLEGKMDDADEDDNIEIDQITGEPVDCGGSWNIVWDLQSTHGTRIARQHYAVHIGFPGKLQPEMIATFKEISKLWHQFLEESSSAEKAKEAKASKRKRDSQKTDEQQQQSTDSPTQITRNSKQRKNTQEEEPAQKRKEIKETREEKEEKKKKKLEDEIRDGLRKLLRPKATWRSDKQAESIRSIMALKADQTAINVLPTGAGKSILFMLPAVMQDTGTSIVVVPFVALMDNLVTRATDMGVDCIRYRSSMNSGREGMPRAARLIVVSADIVSSAKFCGYVDGLSCTGLLQRIFVDECHTVIMDIGYRAKLGELVGLRRFGCPLVLLTATLPVVLEDWFRGEMLARSAIVVRDRTVKLNCRYEVQQVKPGRNAIEDRTIEVIKQLDQDMTGCQKGVIYCRSKSQCEAIADEIGCGFHHSGMSEQDRHEARTAWVEGRNTSRWIAATTGLGTGIDIVGIVAVVHMEKPYGLVDFVQQIGRGGRRAGEVVRSVIIHDGRPQREDQHRSFVDDINQAQMEAFVSTPGCRRAVISAFMDGAAGETCKDVDGATLCDQCELLREDNNSSECIGRAEEVIEVESDGESDGESNGESDGESDGESNRESNGEGD
jgi:superfamily II DNA helicase RecQ